MHLYLSRFILNTNFNLILAVSSFYFFLIVMTMVTWDSVLRGIEGRVANDKWF